jgi:formylglycine-generating enzyme required for sulfatase activity
MYLYLELWKAKDAWFRLTADERQTRTESIVRDAREHPVAGAVPFNFRMVGGAPFFDGATTEPVLPVALDPGIARPTGFHLAAAWMAPTRRAINALENRFRNLGWVWDFFEQQNAWGVMSAEVTLADMIQGGITAAPPSFEGTRAGEERDGYCWCPPGTFKMGFPGTDVTLTRGFWMAKYAVTQELYLSVMEHNPSAFIGDSLPVDSVNREEALQLCRRLTERERSEGRLPSDWEYNLPTEAQWEYAARAGTTARFEWGDDESLADEYSWHMFNSGAYSHPVGQKKPNAWGLYDMMGNCLERLRDVWIDTYPGGTDPEVKPDDVPVRSDEAPGRWGVCRGGGFFIPPLFTPRDRTRLGPGNQGYLLGLRLAIVRATDISSRAAPQELIDWGVATMGHWVSDPGPFDPHAPGGQGLQLQGSSSARFLRHENGLEGQFRFGGLTGHFVTKWDGDAGLIVQSTVNSDGGAGRTVITREDGKWVTRETATYPDGGRASSTDFITHSEDGTTMEHHITKRKHNGDGLPDIRFVLRRVGN